MKRIPDAVFATLATALVVLTLVASPAVPAAAQNPPPSKSPSAKAAPKAKKAPKATRAAKAPFEGKLSINSATAQEFEKLPRVGPKLAQRIVQYREEHKSFRSVEELRNVKGVGAKMLQSIKPHLTL